MSKLDSATRPGADQHRQHVALIVLATCFSIVLGLTLFRRQTASQSQLRPMTLDAEWIAAPPSSAGAGNSAYFRKTIQIPGNIVNGWIAISAIDAYEVSVNRNPLGRFYLWRPTRPFHNGMSEKGQRLTEDSSALALNFPREYQWDGHDSFRVPQYISITNSLRPGKNVICVELESRSAPARASFVGEIQLASGQVIKLGSDETWRAEPVPPGPQLYDWTEPKYRDAKWRFARAVEPPKGPLYRTLDPAIYSKPFQGKWLRHPAANSEDAVWFENTWNIAGQPKDGWLRLAANRQYTLFLNDVRVAVAGSKGSDLDSGDWILGRQLAIDPVATPELLDPDEVGAIYSGKRFESPRHADPRLENFTPLERIQRNQEAKRRSTNQNDMPGTYDPRQSLAQSRRSPDTPEGTADTITPKALSRDRIEGGFLAYNVSRLLKSGENKIAIRMCQPTSAAPLNWSPQVAVDGFASTSGSGSELPTTKGWQCRVDRGVKTIESARSKFVVPPSGVEESTLPFARSRANPGRVARYERGGQIVAPSYPPRRLGSDLPASARMEDGARLGTTNVPETQFPQQPKGNLSAIATGPALTANGQLPALQYRGIAHAPSSTRNAWPFFILACGIVTALVLIPVVRCTRWPRGSQIAFGVLLLPTVTLAMFLLLDASFAERHEMLLFSQISLWNRALVLSGAFAVAVAFLEWLGRQRQHRADLADLRERGHKASQLIDDLPKTTAWKFAVIWVLILCGFLRAYKLDNQPLDDDEYASTQAVMAIVETGVPKFQADDVYYTRSPLFHYATAAVAKIFGPDLWTLRLQSVAWSMATAWMLYLFGSRLLNSPFVGMASMILFSVHPFQIFTGHVIRFYQMQQFFALLTVYLFCIGFVQSHRKNAQTYRYLTCLSFLAAVLSQEISVVMAFPLAVGFLLFAKDLGWKANLRLAILSALAMVVILLDYAVFQTRCLTRVEGVSPNLEAAVKPHFWYPYNFLSIYIGYSRLHLLLSVFLFAGIPLVGKERNRNTIALHIVLLGGVVFTNLLVTAVSLRYQYWLIPIWILLSVESIRLIVGWACDWAYHRKRERNRHQFALGMSMVIIIVAAVVSWSPWRIPGSYDIKILGDSTGAMRFVSSQLRTGDRIAATEPHTHCGFLEAGQIDYDVSVPFLYDYAVFQDGKHIDRNGGAELVKSLDDFMKVCRENDRVWILLNREKFRTRGKNIRWEYPGARFESFVRKNCELKHRTYLWSVFLWDSSRGFYVPYRQHAG